MDLMAAKNLIAELYKMPIEAEERAQGLKAVIDWTLSGNAKLEEITMLMPYINELAGKTNAVIYEAMPQGEQLAMLDGTALARAAAAALEIALSKMEYSKKEKILNTYFENVEAAEFYRDIFPVGAFERKGKHEDGKPNGLAKVIKDSQPKKDGTQKGKYTVIVTDELSELDELQSKDFVVISPLGYYGKHRTANNAAVLYGITVDLDGVEEKQLTDLLFQIDNDVLPRPAYIVNSGHGLHLYYLLDNPLRLTKSNKINAQAIKYALIRLVWNAYTSNIKTPEIQGIYQGYRMVGSPSKLGAEYPVKAYKTGEKMSIETLSEYMSQRDMLHFTENEYSIKEARELFPEWYERRVVNKMPPGQWKIKKDLYKWWISEISKKIVPGHRYFAIMALAVYAKKCGVSREELEADAMALIPAFDELSQTDRFTREDVEAALNMFDTAHAYKVTKEQVSKWSGIAIKTNKRNGQKQAEHLEEARMIRDLRMKRQGRKWTDGNGRPSAAAAVRAWRAENPDSTKAACCRETGLTKPTVYKWWNE